MKTNKIKQELSWHIAAAYIEHLGTFCVLFRDKKFERMFTELEKYVSEKINVPNDIIETYVIVEHTQI
ncbi:MAG: hypothetical protein K2N53_05030 [Clostridia bacterium]|nr:hypothetical protein [Clostridia bacterium]MDE7349007.1 hypothetical protein [Clostridia bacterium]